MSPCKASPALIKLEGDPVLERVADIFFAICPDLPIPKVNILPLALSKLSQTSLNSFDKFFDKFSIPFASSFKVFRADNRWFIFFIGSIYLIREVK